MGKLILFPKNKSKKITGLQKREARRLALSLTAFSVAAMAIVLSERIYIESRPQYVIAGSADRLDQLNRAIASAQPFTTVEDIDWEHEFAKKLNDNSADKGNRQPASVGERPDIFDQLQYGPLAGKYKLTGNSSKIQEIEYIDSSDVSDKPVHLNDCKSFLVDFKKLFMVPFENVEIDTKNDKSQTYSLFDQGGKVVGRAAFQFDELGQFLSLKVQDVK